MDINTRYSIGDKVFYYLNNNAVETIIEEVIVKTSKYEANRVKYKTTNAPFVLYEDELYPTKEALLNDIENIMDVPECIKKFNMQCKAIGIPFWAKYHYPLTIVKDRYKGAYSGGFFTAWPFDEYDIPKEHSASDRICIEFWDNVDKSFIGIGDNPNDAFKDLCMKMKEKKL